MPTGEHKHPGVKGAASGEHNHPDLEDRLAAVEAHLTSVDERVTVLEEGAPIEPPVEPPIEPPIEPPTGDGPARNFVTDFGAVGDGATDNSPALSRWLDFARANPGATLNVPAGYFLFLSIVKPGEHGWANPTQRCKNATIAGEPGGGTKFNRLFMGSTENMQYSWETAGRIRTVAAGANVIELASDADIAKFGVGNWIMVTGLGLMRADSYPLSFQYFEYHKIISQNGNKLVLDGMLKYDYKATWPLVRTGVPHCDYGGPGTIYKCTWDDVFDNTSTFRNLTVDPNTQGDPQVFCGCQRNYVVENCRFLGQDANLNLTTFSPSNCVNFWVRNTKWIKGTGEIDKQVSYLEIDGCTTEGGPAWYFQSSSVDQFVLKNSQGTLAGIARVTRVENCDLKDNLMVGPAFFGAGESLQIINTKINLLSVNKRTNNRTDYEWAGNGVLRIAYSNPNIALVFQYAIPGFRWAIGGYQNGTPPGYQFPLPLIQPDDGSGVIDFKITDLTGDNNYVYVHTDLTSWPPPEKLYYGEPWSLFHLYGVKTLTTQNVTAPGDISFMAEPGGYHSS